MPRFRFEFEHLLKYRRHRRDLRRQMLNQVLADDQALAAQNHALEQARLSLLADLRRLCRQGDIDIDRAASRRFYAGQLIAEMQAVQQRQAVVAGQLELCRQALTRADQEVKALEKLEERRRSEFKDQRQRREQRELEEVWSAAHRG